ncbi:M16 family metallopeptidase [Sphingobacterium lumbrici]|uniref:M16 family metallopeptidase n=1 Tax=Sphingobacterium lumbrici TaxID=2559600 RepID=UPI0011296508|nr:pitrilysin family protein [Sphingobacterium lumbrici]
MLNRFAAPEFQTIKDLTLVHPESVGYTNGLKAFVFQAAELDLIKFEFVFDNVFDDAENPLLNTVLCSMLKEGTKTYTSAQIAEHIDFYGAYLMPEYSFDHTALTLYTMHKYVDKVLPLVKDILTNSIMPQKELDTYIRNNKQSLLISLQKNDFVARRLFYQQVFGTTRYGVVPTPETYDTIGREALLELYYKQFRPSNCTLFIAGNVDNAVLGLVDELFSDDWGTAPGIVQPHSLQLLIPEGKLILESKTEALQSAIRMGGLMINRTHADFPAVQFVNTLLGGFFGSRLMANIREDKGYTYSIGSAVGNLKYGGFFTIASEVGTAVTKAALTEIENEFENLQQRQPSVKEVELVRNYLLGVMLGSLESIFSHVDKFKAVYFSGLDLSYYSYYNKVIQEITPANVQDIAIRYFDYSKLVKIVVGKMD